MNYYHSEDPHRYDDMLDLPHHRSTMHPPLSSTSRAAQFSPFAALTGYEDQITSAHQMRSNRTILSEEELTPIHEKLRTMKKHDPITVTYFREDPGTDGAGGIAEGEYVTITGEVLDIRPAEQILRAGSKEKWVDIAFTDILRI